MRSKQTYLILFVLLISATIRLWRLGNIPGGLSINEVELGLWLSRFLGDVSLSAPFVRFPFFILSLFSLYLFYKVSEKLTEDFYFSIFSTAILALTPWHIIESRVYSTGMLVFTLSLLLILLVLDRVKKVEGVVKLFFILIAGTFFLSIFIYPKGISTLVDTDRNLVRATGINLPSRPFVNKLTYSYRYKEMLVFENLDFGNYFFKGYPRERWGVDETQKFLAALLPLFFIGLFKVGKKNGWLLFSWSAAFVFLPGIVGQRLPSMALPLSFPIIFLSTKGAFLLWNKRNRIFVYLIGLFFVFELLYFGYGYFNQFSESRFSVRRKYYIELVDALERSRDGDERVLVTQRIDNPESFFKFYLKGKALSNFEFRTFNIWHEQTKDGLFIDVLPEEPSPAEPMYGEEGYPDEIAVLEEIEDESGGQTVVLYRYK